MSEIIVKEPVLFQSENGIHDILIGHLLSIPSKIVNIEFWTSEGYQIVPELSKLKLEIKNNLIQIQNPPESIPYLKSSDLILPLNTPNSYPTTQDGKMGLLHSETGLWLQKQVLITYETKENRLTDIISHINSKNNVHEEFANELNSKFSTKSNIDLFVFGDSISAGANASKLMNLTPNLPPYPNILINHLKEKFPNKYFNLMNSAKGGMASKWGMKEISKILEDSVNFNFDIAIIAWGANDAAGKVPVWKYIRHIRKQIKRILKVNSDSLFFIIGSSLPNALWRPSNHRFLFAYQIQIKKFVKKHAKNSVFIDITEIWKQILKIKTYYDITGNGLNHPNDFGHKIYADLIYQIIENTISKKES